MENETHGKDIDVGVHCIVERFDGKKCYLNNEANLYAEDLQIINLALRYIIYIV